MKHIVSVLGAGLLAIAAATATPAIAASSSDFDGTYVGSATSTSGPCTDSRRELVLVVKRGVASMVWQYREGKSLVGEVEDDGTINLHSEGASYQINAAGRVQGPDVTLTSSSTSQSGSCSYSMSFSKRDLKTIN